MFLLILGIVFLLGLSVSLFVSMDDEALATIIITALWVLAISGATGVGAYRELSTRNTCLRLGYPHSQVTAMGFGDAYCIARTDQTDVVTPLGKAVPR